MAKKQRDSKLTDGKAGKRAQNAAIDTTETVAKVTAGVAGAAAIGAAKGLGRALWRGVGPGRK